MLIEDIRMNELLIDTLIRQIEEENISLREALRQAYQMGIDYESHRITRKLVNLLNKKG